MTPLTPHPAFDLTGRVAVVTGAGSPSGIGFATARLLRGLGARVLLAATTDRIQTRVAELMAEPGDDSAASVLGYAADLTDPVPAAGLVALARDIWGRLDILVNNAGMVAVSPPPTATETAGIDGLTLAGWHAALARNLDTAFLVTQAALPLLLAQGWGRVVMVSSVTGPVMAATDDVAYAAAKAALVGLTRALAIDTAARGVTVNAVAPGWIATGSQTPSEEIQGRATPMRRSGTAAEVAAAIAWLVSPGAGYTTGQLIVIDGGNSVAEQRA